MSLALGPLARSTGIRVENLGKRFGSRSAVEGLSFEVGPGEVYGLLGPNGAGKTTTVRMLAGLLRPSEGRAEVAGIALPLEGAGSELRSRIGLLTEQPGLYDRLSARENLDFFIRLQGLEESKLWPQAEAWMDRLGLKARDREPVGGFSKGMRQKLAIVRTLLHRPPVLFLDEPTSGLDPQSAREVRDVIWELAQAGHTVVLCSHNLPEVERLCRRVSVIKNRLRFTARLDELKGASKRLAVELEQTQPNFLEALRAVKGVLALESRTSGLEIDLAEWALVPEVVSSLVQQGARVTSVRRMERGLEEAYLEWVKDDLEKGEEA